MARTISISLWIFVIVVGSSIQLSQSFALKILPLPTEGLTPLAIVSEGSGNRKRRLSNDAAWLSLPNEMIVYSGDRVYTGEHSTMVLKFADGSTFKMKPNTLLQVRATREGILIDLKQGEVETTPIVNNFIVKTVDDERVEKPTKNDVAPLQVAEKLEVKTSSTPEPMVPAKRPFTAYPADGAIVFYTNSRELVVSLGEACVEMCQMNAYRNNELWEETMLEKGVRPRITLKLGSNESAEVLVELREGPYLRSLSFAIERYSPEGIRDALASGKTIEVIE